MAETEWRKLRADELRDRALRDAIVILPVASLDSTARICRSRSTPCWAETVAARPPRRWTRGDRRSGAAGFVDRPVGTIT